MSAQAFEPQKETTDGFCQHPGVVIVDVNGTRRCVLCGYIFPAEHDPVNHPIHYTSHPSGVECIQITRHMSFNLGNVVKYLWRSDRKGGLEDLKKARFYLDDEIKRLDDK